MSQGSQQDQDWVIRITRQEALSSHVDDMLKRQMSLRGQGGITRAGKRHWYLQNWFVFMVTGIVAALIAFAFVEPRFDDCLYIQGKIQAMDATEPIPTRITRGMMEYSLDVSGSGWVQVNNERVWMLSAGRMLRPDGSSYPLDMSKLRPGQEVGVHVDSESFQQLDMALGMFVVRHPPADPPAKASQPLTRQSARNIAMGLTIFGIVAGLVGLFVGAVDGVICRTFRRALLAGAVGLLVGFIGGCVSGLVAGLVYYPLNMLAMSEQSEVMGGLSTMGFLVQMGGRGLAWCLAGMAMGLGQGIALRSRRLVLYGFLGGVIGGLLGGLLFDPVDMLLLGGMLKPSAHWSRLVGFVAVGGAVGAMIGVVELLARDAWLRMVDGPLVGKEFVIFKDTMKVGASPRSDIYLFNDEQVAPEHALIRAVGDIYEIEAVLGQSINVNGRTAQRARLRHGDMINIGRTAFAFEKRKG